MIKTDYFRIDRSFSNSIGLEEWAIKNSNIRSIDFLGAGMKAMVLDTGVDPSHIDLHGNVTAKNFADSSDNYLDENGHGTFCSGLICAKNHLLGVAPESHVISGKVLYGDARDRGINYEKTICDAIYFGIEEKVDCISMSLGFSQKSVAIERAINAATEKNIVCFAAAGNEGMIGSPYKSYPAAYENVISVAASNSNGLPSWFSTKGIGSNRFEQPEFAISSLEFFYGLLPNNMYGHMIGTSMSTPFLAGSFLIWKGSQSSSKDSNLLNEFRSFLKTKSFLRSGLKWSPYLGYGSIKF